MSELSGPRPATGAFNGLHDASLLSIELDWAAGVASLRLRRGPGPLGVLCLQCEGVKMLEVPRSHPWGPSVAVNEVTWLPASRGGGELQIEVQSGDVIRVVCGGCDLLPPQD